MMHIPEGILKCYRLLFPVAIRNSKTLKWLKKIINGHNEIYNANYYENYVEGAAVRSAPTIAKSIISEYDPKLVIDVGCGTGALLAALRDLGCEVFGLEYSRAAIAFCRERQINVREFDLEKDNFNENHKFDVAVSTEVAEHLPERTADRYIKLLSSLADVVVFTAAPPGQPGKDHVNLQPKSYWISKFNRHGFTHLEDVSRKWSDSWKASGNVENWYIQNLMIFRKLHAV